MNDVNGTQLTTFSEIFGEAIAFFKSLIRAKHNVVIGCARNMLEDILHTSISEKVAVELCRPILVEEIKKSIFSIGNDKSLGPDGYTSLFFKYVWPIME